MGKSPIWINGKNIVKAIENMKSTTENEKERLESIEFLGDTIGFLNDSSFEDSVILLLGATLNQSDENYKIKEAARTALGKIRDRCQHIPGKMHQAMFVSTFLSDDTRKIEKSHLINFVWIVLAIIFLCCLIYNLY